MHGLFIVEFKQFILDTRGTHAWNQIAKKSGLSEQIFLPNQVYPDQMIQGLLNAAAKKDDAESLHETQEAFGQHIAPRLLRMYESQINPAWDALDVIENAETTIHRVVRLRDPNAHPPRLRSTRASPVEVVIHYDSTRRLCGVAVGIAAGVSQEYDEELEIEEEGCTVKGDPSNDIHIRRSSVSASPTDPSGGPHRTPSMERSGP